MSLVFIDEWMSKSHYALYYDGHKLTQFISNMMFNVVLHA